MADIIVFPRDMEEPDLEKMTREELLDCLDSVRTQLDQLDRLEPEDWDSEAYNAWGDRHEELEDLADDIRDRLDDIGGCHV